MAIKGWFKNSRVVLSMILVQAIAAGMQLLSKLILSKGTFIFALIAYRHIVAALCVAPLAIYLERDRPKKFTISVWLWLFVNAIFGITLALGLFYYGLRDTTATYAISFLNLIPISTFLVSIVFRIEKLELKTWAGKAKALGAVVCVGGALCASLYKGKEFHLGHRGHLSAPAAEASNMLRGTLFLIVSCFSYTAWYILQVKLFKVFPLKYWATFLTCIIASVQAIVVGLLIDRSKDSWTLSWNLQLVTILYSGSLATAATFCIVSWAITIKGPSYPTMFNPLSLIFVAISEAILLGAPITVGSLLGMVLVIGGLYAFLWSKRKELEVEPPTGPPKEEQIHEVKV